MMSASLSDAPPASEVMTAGHRLYGKTFGIFAGRSGEAGKGDDKHLRDPRVIRPHIKVRSFYARLSSDDAHDCCVELLSR